MKRILGFVDAMSNWSGIIASFLVVVVILIIDFEVVARYIFNSPTIWATEAMTIVCGIYFVLGGAYCLLLKMHVSVDIIYTTLTSRTKALVDMITAPVIFLYMIVIVWTGGEYAWEALLLRETTGTAANLPLYPLKISFFVAALLMLLQMAAKFIRDFQFFAFGRKAQ